MIVVESATVEKEKAMIKNHVEKKLQEKEEVYFDLLKKDPFSDLKETRKAHSEYFAALRGKDSLEAINLK